MLGSACVVVSDAACAEPAITPIAIIEAATTAAILIPCRIKLPSTARSWTMCGSFGARHITARDGKSAPVPYPVNRDQPSVTAQINSREPRLRARASRLRDVRLQQIPICEAVRNGRPRKLMCAMSTPARCSDTAGDSPAAVSEQRATATACIRQARSRPIARVSHPRRPERRRLSQFWPRRTRYGPFRGLGCPISWPVTALSECGTEEMLRRLDANETFYPVNYPFRRKLTVKVGIHTKRACSVAVADPYRVPRCRHRCY